MFYEPIVAGDLKREAQILVYTHLLHLLCGSILQQPKSVAKSLDCDQLLNNVLRVLSKIASTTPLDVRYH